MEKISETALYRSLCSFESEEDHLQSSTISTHLQEVTENLLGEIGTFMPDYTLHNMRHVINVLNNIGSLIPPEVKLNRSELVLIIYAAALHDMGMLVNRDEAEELKKTHEYKKILAEYDRDASEDEILSELIRRNHVSRSCEYIDKFKDDYAKYNLNFEIDGIDFRTYLKNIVKAHELDVAQLDDVRYPESALIGHDHINVLYLALLLRLGDILDFDKTRVPLCLLEHKKIKNTVSISEWEKHLSIDGNCITDTSIEFQATCHSANTQRLVLDFLAYIEKERRDTMERISKMCVKDRFLKLNSPVKQTVNSDGTYIYGDLEISFDYKKVLSILMGTELYSSPEIFLRELLQNSYDACYTRAELEQRAENAYAPRIKVTYDSATHILSAEDNGIGMNMDSIKNYILKIGNSYYKSKEFQSEMLSYSPVSNFGIGILSCFMVSECIHIESLRYSTGLEAKDPVDIILHFDNPFVERLPSDRTSVGTKISLEVHEKFWNTLNTHEIEKIIKKNTAHQRIPIIISCDGVETTLCKSEISSPEFSKYSDIATIKVDNDVLEGYLAIYGYGHQDVVKMNKLCQQGFRINKSSGTSLKFTPNYISFLGYDINVKKRLLSTKASREGIIDDNCFKQLQEDIRGFVLDYFKGHTDTLIKYLSPGTGNILSKNENELKFLKDNIYFISLNKGKKENITFTRLEATGKHTRIALVFGTVLSGLDKCNYESVTELLKDYEYILICNHNFYYFVQFAYPYSLGMREIITPIPGFAFFDIECDFSRNVTANDYNTKFSYMDLDKDAEIVCDNNIMCYITNNQYNLLRVSYNYNHPLGKLLIDKSEDDSVKAFTLQLSTSIIYAVLDNKPLDNLFKYYGKYMRLIENTFDYSLKSKGIFKNNIIASINNSLHDTVDTALLEQYDLSGFSLSKSDFISWWFV